ncbi:MAG: RNA polymerase sigma factor [Anaerolineae bacterium]|nr:RNA polymerase sigma factor [Anaerolineae bacterium]
MKSDETLAQAIQHGDRSAVGELVTRHHGPLVGYLYRMTGEQRLLAEDLAQETFVRLLRSIHTYQYPRPFKAWLYALATHLARDHYKSADTQRTIALSVDFEIAADDLPEQQAILNDQSQRVAMAIHTLPPHQREAIVLRYYQGLSHAEIGAALHIPIGTVKSRLSIGLARLRELLEGIPHE